MISKKFEKVNRIDFDAVDQNFYRKDFLFLLKQPSGSVLLSKWLLEAFLNINSSRLKLTDTKDFLSRIVFLNSVKTMNRAFQRQSVFQVSKNLLIPVVLSSLNVPSI